MFTVIRQLMWALVLTAIVLTFFEGGLRLLIGGDFFAKAVEINSPQVLRTKLDALQRGPNLKVVMLGDSLVYGSAMAEAGDSEWRSHSLPSLLNNELIANGFYKPHVGNFGMNGLLPKDIEYLVPHFVADKPDILLFDLTLRSFSRDFSPAHAQHSRPWIQDLPAEKPSNSFFFGSPSRSIEIAFANTYIVKVREFVLAWLFEGSIKDWVSKMRNRLGQREATSMPAELLLAMRAKQRYSDIDLLADNPQWLSLNRALSLLAKSHQRTVVFYATENPDILPSLMSAATHTAMIGRLEDAISNQGSSCIIFLPPLKSLVSEDFIDHVHLNYQGNQKLAAELQIRIEQLLKKPC
jgi:lysophospholipase L1-like esterase